MANLRRILIVFGLCSVVCVPAAHASYISIPNANQNVASPSGLSTLLNDEPRTYQMQIASGQLTGLDVGDLITGISWRLMAGIVGSWPTGGVTWSDYEITLAQAANPLASMGTNFAGNMLNPVLVRDGSLTIPPGAFPATSPGFPTANPWGYEITFTPYAYQGGDLVILLSHVGSTDYQYLEAISGDAAVARAIAAYSFQASSGSSWDVTISRFTFTDAAVPEPATLPLVLGGLSVLIVVVRRRAC